YNGTTGNFGSGFAKKVADAYSTTESYKSLNGKIDGLQIGGTNLLDDSSGDTNLLGDVYFNHRGTKDGWTICTQDKASTGRPNWAYFMPVDALADGLYTLSMDVKLLSCTSGTPLAELMIRSGKDYRAYASSGEQLLKVGETVRLTAITSSVATFSKESPMQVLVQFLIKSDFVGQVAIRHVKLEKGSKATDWCMSDGDINKRIQTQADALTAYQAEVKRTYALSSSVYTKTEAQTRENALKNSTISDLKATDDWKKLIKINQNSSWIQDATGFQQQAWKYNLDSSSELIGKKSFGDGNVGEWY
ncbi:hypothetical protein JG675_09435, partial [Campylobacter coli]